MHIGFREKLAMRQRSASSLVCVGLDPLVERMPLFLKMRDRSIADSVELWMKDIVDATAEFACMFKPQIAHWSSISGGVYALEWLVNYIHVNYPEILIFLDCKRGDIVRTQKQYGVECLKLIGADGMNFNPYMGKDCMAALVSEENMGKALVGLCYTSNPDAREIQDLIIFTDGNPLWEHIAIKTLRWAEELGVVADAGLVMAAAYENPKGSGQIYSEHLTRCRQIVGDKLWFLIPGVGAQGGFIAETVHTAYVGPGSIAINSSSEINFASSGEDYAEAAGEKARELRDKINEAL